MTEAPGLERPRDAALGYLLILPALLLFGAFVFYPFLWNFKLALYQTPPVPGLPGKYVGLSQFASVLSSSEFLQSLLSTLVFVAIVVPSGVLLGLLLAVVAHRKLRGIGIFKTIFSSTVASSVAVSAVVFGTLMNPVVGLLPWLGINPQPPLLESPTWSLLAIALMTVWQYLGLSFILMSAGLVSLSDDVLEAARMDGGRAWSRFWHVTVPMLSPTIFFAFVVGTISAFQTFGQIDILIGPENAARQHVNVLLYEIYQALEVQQNPGKAAVVSIALFALTLAVTTLQFRVLERRVHYGR